MSEMWRLRSEGDPLVLEFDKFARACLLDFKGYLEPQMAPDGALNPIVGSCSKLPGQVVRLAADLHMARLSESRGPVELVDVERAVEIAHYLIPHALHALDGPEVNPTCRLANRLKGWIKRTNQAAFTTRDAYRAVNKPVDEVKPALNLLREHFCVRNSGDTWTANPLLGYEDPPSTRSTFMTDEPFSGDSS
jgi:hypothetical protein